MNLKKLITSTTSIVFAGLLFFSISTFATNETRLFDQSTNLENESIASKMEIGDNQDISKIEAQINENPDENNEQKGDPKDAEIALLLASAGLLGIAGTKLAETKDKVKSKLPAGTGLWIPEKDRENIKGIINATANKQFNIDDGGFIRGNNDIPSNENGSKTATELIEKLAESDKLTVMGIGDTVTKQDSNGNTYADTASDGLTVGKSGTNQAIILNQDALKTDNKESIGLIGHEMAHALDGISGTKTGDVNRNEKYAVDNENKIRNEVGLPKNETDSASKSDSETYSGSGGVSKVESRWYGYEVFLSNNALNKVISGGSGVVPLATHLMRSHPAATGVGLGIGLALHTLQFFNKGNGIRIKLVRNPVDPTGYTPAKIIAQ